MPNFAKIISNQVEDLFVADEKGVLETMFPEALFIEETEFTGTACIGGEYRNNKFISVKPYQSWVLDENSLIWNAPIPYPTDSLVYGWDEETISWKEVAIDG